MIRILLRLLKTFPDPEPAKHLLSYHKSDFEILFQRDKLYSSHFFCEFFCACKTFKIQGCGSGYFYSNPGNQDPDP